MKLTKKLLSTVTAAALCMSLTSTFAGSFVNVSAANTTAIDMVEDMGLGWNLGNSLSGSNTWTPVPSRRSRSKLPGAIPLPPKP